MDENEREEARQRYEDWGVYDEQIPITPVMVPDPFRPSFRFSDGTTYPLSEPVLMHRKWSGTPDKGVV